MEYEQTRVEYWQGIFTQQDFDYDDREQFEFACNEVQCAIEEQRAELKAISWLPVGLGIGFSGVLTVCAAFGWIDAKTALTGYLADGFITLFILEERKTLKKLRIPEYIREYQEEVREYVLAHSNDLSVRIKAELAGVYYCDLPSEIDDEQK